MHNMRIQQAFKSGHLGNAQTLEVSKGKFRQVSVPRQSLTSVTTQNSPKNQTHKRANSSCQQSWKEFIDLDQNDEFVKEYKQASQKNHSKNAARTNPSNLALPSGNQKDFMRRVQEDLDRRQQKQLIIEQQKKQKEKEEQAILNIPKPKASSRQIAEWADQIIEKRKNIIQQREFEKNRKEIEKIQQARQLANKKYVNAYSEQLYRDKQINKNEEAFQEQNKEIQKQQKAKRISNQNVQKDIQTPSEVNEHGQSQKLKNQNQKVKQPQKIIPKSLQLKPPTQEKSKIPNQKEKITSLSKEKEKQNQNETASNCSTQKRKYPSIQTQALSPQNKKYNSAQVSPKQISPMRSIKMAIQNTPVNPDFSPKNLIQNLEDLSSSENTPEPLSPPVAYENSMILNKLNSNKNNNQKVEDNNSKKIVSSYRSQSREQLFKNNYLFQQTPKSSQLQDRDLYNFYQDNLESNNFSKEGSRVSSHKGKSTFNPNKKMNKEQKGERYKDQRNITNDAYN